MLRIRHNLNEVLWAHALKSHHFRLREPSASVADPMTVPATTGQARSAIMLELHERQRAIAIDNPRLTEGIVSLLLQLRKSDLHVV